MANSRSNHDDRQTERRLAAVAGEILDDGPIPPAQGVLWQAPSILGYQSREIVIQLHGYQRLETRGVAFSCLLLPAGVADRNFQTGVRPAAAAAVAYAPPRGRKANANTDIANMFERISFRLERTIAARMMEIFALFCRLE
jgi:hypothetical protein